MAKKKLTEKLKAEIRANYTRIKKSDLSDNAAAYLKRVRAGHKAAKTRAEKKEYVKRPRYKAGPITTIEKMIDSAAIASGTTPAKFRKKHAKDIEQFRDKTELHYDREIDNIKNDVRFLPKGKSIYVNGVRTNRNKAVYLLTRVKNAVVSTGATYEHVHMEHSYDGNGNIHLNLPTPAEMIAENKENENDEETFLNWIQENYAIKFYRK
jgi:hypothetical protein